MARQLAEGQAPASPVTGRPLEHGVVNPNRLARHLCAALRERGLLSPAELALSAELVPAEVAGAELVGAELAGDDAELDQLLGGLLASSPRAPA